MRKSIALLLSTAALATALGGCGYSGVAASADKAVVSRNDGFLFGILRKVFVCKITDGGLSNCQTADSP